MPDKRVEDIGSAAEVVIMAGKTAFFEIDPPGTPAEQRAYVLQLVEAWRNPVMRIEIMASSARLEAAGLKPREILFEAETDKRIETIEAREGHSDEHWHLRIKLAPTGFVG